MANLKIKTPDGSWKALATQEYVDNNKSNWNAKEGEPGYVENRTHYEEGSGIYKVNFYWQGDESTAIDVRDGMFVGYGLTRVTDKIIAANDLKDFKSTMIFEGSPIEADSYEWYHLNGDWLCRIHYPTGNTFYDQIVLGYFATTGNKADLFNLDPSATEVTTEVIVSNTGLYNAATLAFTAANGKLEEVIYDFGEHIIKTLDAKFLPETVVMAERPEMGVKEVVILPETELTTADVEEGSNGQYVLITPLENTPSVGGTYKMVWGGVEYTSKAVEVLIEAAGAAGIALGNTDYLGLDNVENPGAGMPILVVLFPDGVVEDPGDPAMYCIAISMGITPEPPVLSIVQGSAAVPKQLVMDTDGNIKWEDRTHYDEIIPDVAIWADDAPELMFSENGMSLFRSLIVPTHSLINGQEYTVIVNGVEYVRSCTYMQDGNSGYYLLGNIDFAMETGNNGDPFVIMLLPPELFDPNDPVGAGVYEISGILDGTGVGATAITASVSGPVITVHKIDEKYLPDSTINVSPNWDASEGQDGHVLNRTHWIDPEGLVVISHDQFSVNAGYAAKHGFNMEVGNTIPIVAGATYIVKWGETEYTCLAKTGINSTSYKSEYTIYLGNGSAEYGVEDTGEPFCIDFKPDGIHFGIRTYANTPSITGYTIAVGPGGVYHQIDNRFINLPKIVNSDWNAAEGADGHVLNRTHYQSSPNFDPITLKLSCTEITSDGITYAATYTTPVSFVTGRVYNITWNGVTHKYLSSLDESNTDIMHFYRYAPDAAGMSLLGSWIFAYHVNGFTAADGNTYNFQAMRYLVKAEVPNPELVIEDTGIHGLNSCYLPEPLTLQQATETGALCGSPLVFGDASSPFGNWSFTYGDSTSKASGKYAFAMNGKARGEQSVAFGGTAGKAYSSVIGDSNKANAGCAHAQGCNTEANGIGAHAEGRATIAGGSASHAEGHWSAAEGYTSHAEGYATTAQADQAHAEGYATLAQGKASHSEGYLTFASGERAHAEGSLTVALGVNAHAENCGSSFTISVTKVENPDAIQYTTPDADRLFVGQYLRDNSAVRTLVPEKAIDDENDEVVTYTIGSVSKPIFAKILEITGDTITLDKAFNAKTSDGSMTVYALVGGANGIGSHVEGFGTLASSEYQHVQGTHNVEDAANVYAHIVGNGSAYDARSNAHVLDWDGNARFAGDVYVNGTGTTGDLHDAKKVATEELVAEKVALPKSAGIVDHGTAGQFAVSDGMGGIMWKTIVEAEEVAY